MGNIVPVWITNSAIDNPSMESGQPASAGASLQPQSAQPSLMETDVPDQTDSNSEVRANEDDDEITQILLRHERKAGDGARAALPGDSESDKSDESDMEDVSDTK